MPSWHHLCAIPTILWHMTASFRDRAGSARVQRPTFSRSDSSDMAIASRRSTSLKACAVMAKIEAHHQWKRRALAPTDINCSSSLHLFSHFLSYHRSTATGIGPSQTYRRSPRPFATPRWLQRPRCLSLCAQHNLGSRGTRSTYKSNYGCASIPANHSMLLQLILGCIPYTLTFTQGPI